jgi:hypothetical protein
MHLAITLAEVVCDCAVCDELSLLLVSLGPCCISTDIFGAFLLIHPRVMPFTDYSSLWELRRGFGHPRVPQFNAVFPPV